MTWTWCWRLYHLRQGIKYFQTSAYKEGSELSSHNSILWNSYFICCIVFRISMHTRIVFLLRKWKWDSMGLSGAWIFLPLPELFSLWMHLDRPHYFFNSYFVSRLETSQWYNQAFYGTCHLKVFIIYKIVLFIKYIKLQKWHMFMQIECKDIKGKEKPISGPNSKVLKV